MKNRKRLFVLLPVCLFFCFSCVAFATDRHITDSFFAPITDFIKWLFLPSDNYFHNQLQKLSELFYARLGIFTYLYKLIRDFFAGFASLPTSQLVFSLPDDYFFTGFNGMSVNLLSTVNPYVKFLRDVLNAFCCVTTAVVTFKHIQVMFKD